MCCFIPSNKNIVTIRLNFSSVVRWGVGRVWRSTHVLPTTEYYVALRIIMLCGMAWHGMAWPGFF